MNSWDKKIEATSSDSNIALFSTGFRWKLESSTEVSVDDRTSLKGGAAYSMMMLGEY